MDKQTSLYLKKIIMTDDKYNNIKCLLRDFITLLDKYKINYFAYAGTLLGICRNNSIIPWDDEIDLGINTNQVKIMLSNEFLNDLAKLNCVMLSQLYNCTYNCQSAFIIYRTSDIADKKLGKINTFISEPKTNYLDISVFTTNCNNEVIPLKFLKNKQYKFLKQELYPLVDKKFCDVMIPCANNFNPHLIRNYGDKWKTEGVVYKSHNPKIKKYTNWLVRTKNNKVTNLNYLYFKYEK